MYELILSRNAERDLKRLDAEIQRRVRNKLEWLRENCGQCFHKPLTGRYEAKFILRCGDYRAIYTYDEEATMIEVSRIRHRSVVYK